ncbi:helix-turn-helix domain-containing protein [Streptomyces sp. p1417]|uniref:Helix-turn-helix domain-containing protein n=1 Tax=Streptomyces typhae TaxID=2681492 RepID=A0A6L6X1K8_9ACTN|nr:IclR family transcriptional regulator C-terminal domain-containing protein [Streptomyces typhae]MVO87695.1 helix-turn-helix domain-containing protein [Streptomyces typhae]
MSGEAVGPLERGLAVLHAMAANPSPRMRRSDLTAATGLLRSPVDRIIATLLRLGYVRADGRDVLLTPRVMELGNAYLASCGLVDALEPYVVELADELDESVSLAVPDRDGARLITQAVRRRAMYLAFHIGDLLPAERSAAGVVLAGGWEEAQFHAWRARRRADPLDAGFPAVPPRDEAPAEDESERCLRSRAAVARRAGWALDEEWVEPGLLAVAAPVRDPAGRILAAVSVLTHTSRHTAADFPGHVMPRLQAAVDRMEAALRRATGPTARPAPAAQGLAPQPAARPASTAQDLRESKDELGMEFLESLARGLAVLSAFGSAGGGLTISAAAAATGLSRATARRALLTLRHLGYADSQGPTYHLLPRVLDLGHARLSCLTLTDISRPHLAELAALLGESASVAVLDEDDIRYLARAATSRVLRIDITSGTRLPAGPTSMGRVLLAALPPGELAARIARTDRRPRTPHTLTAPRRLTAAVAAAARDGYALVDQELQEGLRSLAVPLHDRGGHVVAALNVAVHAGRSTPQEMVERVLPALRDTASRIEADLSTAFAYVPLVVE